MAACFPVLIWSGWVVPGVSKLLEVGLREPVLTSPEHMASEQSQRRKESILHQTQEMMRHLHLYLRILKYSIGNSPKPTSKEV